MDEGLAIDLTGRDLLTMWKLLSPYMARLLAILKHSNINLHIVRTSEGEKLQRSLEEVSCSICGVKSLPVSGLMQHK